MIHTVVTLDASMTSTLNWDTEISADFSVIWNLDLGLFDRLSLPIGDQTQYLSLRLAIDHFVKTVFEPFKHQTIGVSLYAGSADFHGTPPDDAIEFIELLSTNLPEGLRACVMLHSVPTRRAERLLALSPSRFQHLDLIVDQPDDSLPGWIWDGDTVTERDAPNHSIGVLLPAEDTEVQGFSEALLSIKEPFRSVAESLLIYSWDGLDQLYVIEEGFGPQTVRKLQGFEAAGGEVLSL